MFNPLKNFDRETRKHLLLILVVFLCARGVYQVIGQKGRIHLNADYTSQEKNSNPWFVHDSAFYAFLASHGYNDRQWEKYRGIKETLRVLIPTQPQKYDIEYEPYTKELTEYPFYPFYPYLIHNLAKTGLPPITAGLFISNLSLLVGTYFLYFLLRKDFSTQLSITASLLYLVQPLSPILMGMLTESLFNCMVFMGIFYLRNKRYVLVAILAMCLAITRANGILFILMALVAVYGNLNTRPKFFRFLILFSVPALISIGMHFSWLYIHTGDFLASMHAQQPYGRELNPFLWIKVDNWERTFELAYFVLGFVIFFNFCKKTKTSNGNSPPLEYIVFGAANFLLILSTASIDSAPRYMLSIFPIIIGVAWWLEKSKTRTAWLGFSFLLSCGVMFYWTRAVRMFM